LFPTLGEKHGLRTFENITDEDGEYCIVRSFDICTLHQIIIGGSKKDDETCWTYDNIGNEHKIFVGNHEEKGDY
jgi:hypothetical protein